MFMYTMHKAYGSIRNFPLHNGKFRIDIMELLRYNDYIN